MLIAWFWCNTNCFINCVTNLRVELRESIFWKFIREMLQMVMCDWPWLGGSTASTSTPATRRCWGGGRRGRRVCPCSARTTTSQTPRRSGARTARRRYVSFKPSMYLKYFHLNLSVAFLDWKYYFLPLSGAGDRNPGAVQGETHSVLRKIIISSDKIYVLSAEEETRERPDISWRNEDSAALLRYNSLNKSQPFIIVTWRNNEIGILDFGPHGVHYLSSTVSILLLSYFSLTKRRVNFTSFHWRSWTTNNDNNRGFNIFMWYYIFSVKCQSICIWALILLYFNEILSMFSVIFMNFEAFWEGPKKNVKVCILK